MTKPRRVVWLVPTIRPVYKAKQLLLEKHNWQVFWVHTFSELANSLSQQRAHALIISEEGQPEAICDHIVGLSSLIEARGSRWILTLKDHNPKVIKFAIASNFREALPIEMPDKEWIGRFLFAIGSRSLKVQLPMGQVTLPHSADLKMPCRLIWLNETRLRLESHLTPPLGAKLTLTGTFLEELRLKQATLLVEKVENSFLNYRYSRAIEGTWVPNRGPGGEDGPPEIHRLGKTTATKARIFIAVRDASMRRAILKQLTPKEFEIASALNMKSLELEPMFFSPDLILVQNGLAHNIGTLPPEVPVLVLDGIEPTFLSRVRALLPARAHNKDSAVHFEASNRRGFGEIVFHAKVTRIHPQSIELVSPFPIKEFALAQLESPLLQKWLHRSTCIKLAQRITYQEPVEELPVVHAYTCLLADLRPPEQALIAASLCRVLAKVLSPASASEGHDAKQPQKDAVKPYIPKPAPVKATKAETQDAHYFAIFVALLIAAMIAIAVVVPILSKYYKKSGSVYVEQLEIFSRENGGGQKEPEKNDVPPEPIQ